MSTASLVQITPIGSTPDKGASEDEITHYVKYIDDSTFAQCYMLGSMTLELERHPRVSSVR